MATYFSVADEDNKDHLPTAVRERDDISELATLGEWLVIDRYMNPRWHNVYDTITDTTIDNEDGDAVYLRYYTEDADDCTNDDFKYAMMVTIANVIKYMANQKDREYGLKTFQQGRISETYEQVPIGMYRMLRRYDLRPKLHAM